MVGFSVQKSDSLNPVYKCGFCSLVLRDPVQLTNCGHHQCRSCIDDQRGSSIQCRACSVETPRDQIMPDRGFKIDMDKISIGCSHCDWTGVLKVYQDHLNRSHANPICDSCKEQFASTTDLDRHTQLDCPQMEIPCPMAEFGCKDLILRRNMSQHLLSAEHQRLLLDFLQRLGGRQATSVDSIRNDLVVARLQEIDEMIRALLDAVETLSGDTHRLTQESINRNNLLNTRVQDLTQLKESFFGKNAPLDRLIPNLEIEQRNLSLAKEKVLSRRNTSYDGTLLWKISNVQQKIVEAQFNRELRIHSPIFYSSPNGYKMDICIYVTDAGDDLRTYMSLDFILMRGEYDALLQFPFRFKILLCLMDQTNQQRHLVELVQPDPKSPSFQKPRSEMNVPLSISKFVALSVLQQENDRYMHDDTMFIKVIVDFADSVDPLSEYGFNLAAESTTQLNSALTRQASGTEQQQPTSMN